ncbi:prostaglandin E synthase 3b [Diretmus argenteus]
MGPLQRQGPGVRGWENQNLDQSSRAGVRDSESEPRFEYQGLGERLAECLLSLHRHPATAKWYDRRDSVFIEFCVADSKDVKVNFDKAKFGFSCVGGTDDTRHENEVDLFEAIDQKECKHKRTDRSVLCCLRKAEPGKAWPRLTKDKAKLTWLSVDFNNWKDWEDDSDEEIGGAYDQFSDMMNNMGGGDDDLPDLDGADEDESADSDDEKMPDLE